MTSFRVGVTGDIVGADGELVYDLSPLDAEPGVETTLISSADELGPDDVAGLDVVVLFHPRLPAATIAAADRLLLVARLGVGVDNIDVDACTEHGVLVTVTPDAVQRPMAVGAMAFVLALAHRLREKDRDVRASGWNRFAHIGTGLAGRTLGIVGLGNVGSEVARLAEPFGLRLLAADPYPPSDTGAVEIVELDVLLAESDVVVVACPLTPETHHLLDATRLSLLKPTAYLVNIARGPIVDQTALTELLRSRRIAGAGLDVFEQEPLDAEDPLLSLDNVLLAPHAVGLTDELFRLGAESVTRSVTAVARGDAPAFLLNSGVLERDDVRRRLAERARARPAVAPS